MREREEQSMYMCMYESKRRGGKEYLCVCVRERRGPRDQVYERERRGNESVG